MSMKYQIGNFFFRICTTVDLATYLTKFQWEMAKFPIKQSLRGIVDSINNLVTQIENDLKSKSTNYNNLKSNLANMERKQTYVYIQRLFSISLILPLQ